MSYYKVTYESNTIEGLKAIQGNFNGKGTSASDSSTFETTVSPPPHQQDEKDLNGVSNVMPAPPNANDSGTGFDNSDENAFFPPPKVADSATLDIGMEGEFPPPPQDEIEDQEGNEDQPDEGIDPPQSKSKSSKTPKKGSK